MLLPCCPQVLVEGGATIELQDALGRSALMFAAGSDATAACNVLLEAHASLSARDRRGRAALDYAPDGEGNAAALLGRFGEDGGVFGRQDGRVSCHGLLARIWAALYLACFGPAIRVGFALVLEPSLHIMPHADARTRY